MIQTTTMTAGIICESTAEYSGRSKVIDALNTQTELATAITRL